LFAVLRDEWEVERPEMRGKEIRQIWTLWQMKTLYYFFYMKNFILFRFLTLSPTASLIPHP
jgi:hypothetical protein